MSEHEPELDDVLRRKLHALGQQVTTRLDGSAELRILKELQRETKRSARRITMRRISTLGLIAAAAAALFAWLGHTTEEPAAPRVETCPWSKVSPVFASTSEGASELSLGSAGRVVLADGAQASATIEGCAITVELTQGALAARLGNLSPGSLRVRTSLGDVQVRGTTFSVDVADGLQVVLLEGRVELSSEGEPTISMTPGKTLRRKGRTERAVVLQSSAVEAQGVSTLMEGRRAVRHADARSEPADEPEDLPATNPPARARPSDLLGQAEAARRSGDGPRARALYGRAQHANNADAEVALLRHAGFELEEAHPKAAQGLLAAHRQRFPRSRLAAEAAWLEVRARDASGDHVGARTSAQRLVERFPNTPQAHAARRLLDRP